MKILLPTDGSEYSEAAARFLTRLNLSEQDEVFVLHVVSDDAFQDKEDYYYSRIKEIRQSVAPKILHSTVSILHSVPAKISPALMSGLPEKCIIDAANDADADIIVMGPKRIKGIKSRIVGSVTKSVSIASPRPVLVVKQALKEPKDTLKILFTTDGSASANRAGEILALMPFHDNTEITVLHVISAAFHDIPDRFIRKIDANVRENLKEHNTMEIRESQKIIAHNVAYLMDRFSNVRTLTKTGDPSDEILQTANELGADMIVLGSKGMEGFKGVIESISRYILSAADCAVLIGKTGHSV
jgi:nucleotide-binding universal stress UspA family protein